jgi:hypothetical protein
MGIEKSCRIKFFGFIERVRREARRNSRWQKLSSRLTLVQALLAGAVDRGSGCLTGLR